MDKNTARIIFSTICYLASLILPYFMSHMIEINTDSSDPIRLLAAGLFYCGSIWLILSMFGLLFAAGGAKSKEMMDYKDE
jgi:hypothetical protein